jgi:three-Cys-motif partner protein
LPPKFHGNGIILSGETGTKPKSDILGLYYPFWWGIASGGKKRGHPKNTAIIDLNAATGRVYVEETGEEVFGSAGHALQLKLDTPGTDRLKVILVEQEAECFSRLKNVIHERWSKFPTDEAQGPVDKNLTQVYLVNQGLDETLNIIEIIDNHSRLGLAIFLFDPLRSIAWDTVQRVASRRIPTFYKIGTEFIIFLFTSDFFLGRDEFVPLPNTDDPDKWSSAEIDSVNKTDSIFPNEAWRHQLLTNKPVKEREDSLVKLYKLALHGWFRYVLALPFRPKKEQIYHLFFCSNYEAGIRATRSFYTKRAMNPSLTLSNAEAYRKFQQEHPETAKGLALPSKPLEFKILWKVIKEHEEGYCDVYCQDLIKEDQSFERRRKALDWLQEKGYLDRVHYDDVWGKHPPTYMLNWGLVERKLGVSAPSPLTPLAPASEQRKLA